MSDAAADGLGGISGKIVSDVDDSPWIRKTRVYLYRMGSLGGGLDSDGLRGGDALLSGSSTVTFLPKGQLITVAGTFHFRVKPGLYKVRSETVTSGFTIAGACKPIRVTAGSETGGTVRMGGGTVISGRVDRQFGSSNPPSLSGLRVFVASCSWHEPEDSIPTIEAFTDETGYWKAQFPITLATNELVSAEVALNTQQRDEMSLKTRLVEGSPTDFFQFFISDKEVDEVFDCIEIEYTGPSLLSDVSSVSPRVKRGPVSKSSLARAILEQNGKTEIQDAPFPDQRIEHDNARAVVTFDDGEGAQVLMAQDVVLKSGSNKLYYRIGMAQGSYMVTLTSDRGVARVPLTETGKALSGSFATWDKGNRFSGTINGPVAAGDEVQLRLADDTRERPYATALLDKDLSFEFRFIPPGAYFIGALRLESGAHFRLGSGQSMDVKSHELHDLDRPENVRGGWYERVLIQEEHFENFEANLER